MPIANTKKAQTIRNLWYERVAKKVLEANATVALIRAAIEDNGLAGQFTAPELAAMLATESDIGVAAGGIGVTAAGGKVVESHRNKALVIPGVND
jgi:hypothetical protein